MRISARAEIVLTARRGLLGLSITPFGEFFLMAGGSIYRLQLSPVHLAYPTRKDMEKRY